MKTTIRDKDFLLDLKSVAHTHTLHTEGKYPTNLGFKGIFRRQEFSGSVSSAEGTVVFSILERKETYPLVLLAKNHVHSVRHRSIKIMLCTLCWVCFTLSLSLRWQTWDLVVALREGTSTDCELTFEISKPKFSKC